MHTVSACCTVLLRVVLCPFHTWFKSELSTGLGNGKLEMESVNEWHLIHFKPKWVQLVSFFCRISCFLTATFVKTVIKCQIRGWMLIYFHYALINEIFAAKRDGTVDLYIEFGYSVPPPQKSFIFYSQMRNPLYISFRHYSFVSFILTWNTTVSASFQLFIRLVFHHFQIA